MRHTSPVLASWPDWGPSWVNPHYTRGWHATATAGTVAAAAAASRGLGLDEEQTARALVLAVPAAGGVQGAFGTDAKSLQVGGAAGAGLRAARLAARGASAATSALEDWVRLLGGNPELDFDLESAGVAVPDGLAIKLYPCCYALQRPIGAVTALAHGPMGAAIRSGDALLGEEVERVVVRTPLSTVKPLIHSRPRTGLEGKFSLEYAIAATILDEYPGFSSFTDEAVARPNAQSLLRLVEIETGAKGEGLLAGEVEVEVRTARGVARSRLAMPPGSPDNPAPQKDLVAKFNDCLDASAVSLEDITWNTAATLLDSLWPRGAANSSEAEGLVAQHG